MTISTAFFEKFGKIPSEWRIAAAASLCLHVAFFLLLTFFSEVTYNTKKMPAVIDVDLSWMSAPPAAKKTIKVKKKSAVIKKKSRRKVKKKLRTQVKKKKIALKPKKKKTKKKVAKSKDIINDAIERLKKDLDKPEPDSLAERMKQLEKEIETDGRTLVDNHSTEEVANGSGRESTLIDRYMSYVKVAVQEEWAFSKNLAGGKTDLKTIIDFIVMPNGEIRGVRIEKKSGNSYMDSAASMAVVKASPVNPFPPGIKEKFIKMGIIFSPKK